MKKKTVKTLLFLFLFSVLFLKVAHSASMPEQNVTSWEILPIDKLSGIVSSAHENSRPWAKTPSLWASHLLDLSELKAFRIEYVADTIEDNEGSIITVIRDGFLDDSVRGDIHIFRIEKKNHKWLIVSVKKSTKCWKGDGAYSNKPCS